MSSSPSAPPIPAASSIHATIAMILRRILPIAHRVRAIADRVANGTLRRPPAPRTPSTNPKPRPPALRWPFRLRGTHAWLCRIAIQLNPLGTQLDRILRDPAMQALIEAAPQIRTILRPLCRMLGTTTLKPEPPPDVPSRPPAPDPHARPGQPAPPSSPGARQNSPDPPTPKHAQFIPISKLTSCFLAPQAINLRPPNDQPQRTPNKWILKAPP